MTTRLAPIALSYLMATSFPCRADETEDQFVIGSEGIEFISYSYFSIGSSRQMWAPEPRIEKAEKALKDALQIPASFEQLEKLASHANPKVRTLALIKLYELREPNAFPLIAKRLGDTGEAIPNVEISAGSKKDEILVFPEPINVGRVAAGMLAMIGYPPVWGNRQEAFETWSKPRFGNPDWIGWHDFLYRIAIQSSSPVPPEATLRIAALKEKLAAGPEAFRAWFWFGIADDCLMDPAYDTPLATEAEMVEAARRLAPEALLAFLKDGTRAGLREPRIDNPERGRRFILQHAKQLFHEEHSQALSDAGYKIAAADANPKEASTVIRRVLHQGWDGALAMAALLDHQCDAETEFVVNWFYGTPGAFRASSDQSVFIQEYERRKPANWEKPVRALVAHPGFERLQAHDVAYLAMMVHNLSGHDTNSFESTSDEVALRNRLREHFGLPLATFPKLDSSAARASDPLWSTALEFVPCSSSLSPDGSTLAVGSPDGKITLLATSNGAVAGELPAGGAKPQVKFRRSDGILLVADDRGVVSEWDTGSRKKIREAAVHRDYSRAVLSEAGDLLVVHDSKGPALHDLKARERRWQSRMDIGGDGIMVFSPDGTRLAMTTGSDPVIWLFDTAQAIPIARIEGHCGVPSRALFSPAGEYLVSSARDDMKVIVWDGVTGKKIKELVCNEARSYPYPLGFTSAPLRVLLADGNKKVSIFDIDSGKADRSFQLSGSWANQMFPVPEKKRWIGVEQEYHQEDNQSRATGRVECWSAEPIPAR